MTKPLRKGVFPVAGLGTRFLPATKSVPKEMFPVVDRPLIHWAVDEALAAGIREFCFVTATGKGAIEDYFSAAPTLEAELAAAGKSDFYGAIKKTICQMERIEFVIQEEALGLGHAVWCARDFVGDEAFAVLLPDDLVLADTPCLKQMCERYAALGGNLVAVMDVPREQTSRYGILDVGREDGSGDGSGVGSGPGCVIEVAGLVEKPAPAEAPSTLSIIGRYILQSDIFKALGQMKKGAGGEIQLTDAMGSLIGKMPFHGLRFEGKRFDCGHKTGFLEANIAFALDRDDMAGDVRALCREFSR